MTRQLTFVILSGASLIDGCFASERSSRSSVARLETNPQSAFTNPQFDNRLKGDVMMETLNDPDRQTRVLLGFLVVVGIVLTVVAWFQLVF